MRKGGRGEGEEGKKEGRDEGEGGGEGEDGEGGGEGRGRSPTDAHSRQITRHSGSKLHTPFTTKLKKLTLRHGKDLTTDLLRILFLEELTLPAMTHPLPVLHRRRQWSCPLLLDDHCPILSSRCGARGTPFPDSISGVCHSFLLGARTPSLIPQWTRVLHHLQMKLSHVSP